MSVLKAIAIPERAPRAAAILVHGLGGDAYQTWSDGNDTVFYWPKSLATDIEDLAVYSVEYDAPISRFRAYGMHLVDQARNILEILLIDHRLDDLPLVFIGHSLGGLIITKLIQIADSQSERRFDAYSLLDRLYQGIFIGTPHFGSCLATWADRFRTIIRPTLTTACLARSDPNLRDLNLWYREYAAKRTLRNLVLRESIPAGIFGMIVSVESSDPGLPGSPPIPIGKDHLSICRPGSRDDEVYKHVQIVLSTLLALSNYSAYETSELSRVVNQTYSIDRTLRVLAGKEVEPIPASRLIQDFPKGAIIVGPSGFGKTTLAFGLFRSTIVGRRDSHNHLPFGWPFFEQAATHPG